MKNPIKNRSAVIPLLLAVALGAVAQQPDRLQQDVKYLASEALEGRRTGTNGATEAARYIAKEFKRLGLKPLNAKAAGSQDRYLQSFPYVGKVELGTRNTLVIHGADTEQLSLRVGEDWVPLGFSSNQTFQNAEIVFAGYGISASELNYNDYANKYNKNQVAVVFDGTPEGQGPHNRFVPYASLRFKAAAARNAGVGALIIISDEENLKNTRTASLNYDNAGEAGLPVLVISRSAASKILTGPNMTLADYAEAADVRTVRPTGSGVPRTDFETTISTTILKGHLTRIPLKKRSLSLSVDVVRSEVPAYNVVGMLEGSDPLLKNEVIIIGAHYDHLGRGGDGSLAPTSGDIHHGADDNASGTAGVLELARLFTAQKPKPKRTIVFMAFGGEEEGLLGSNYYVNHPLLPLANTVAMINMDMIGRMKDRRLVIGGVGTAKEWRDIMAADTDKSFQLTLNEDGFGPSDHSSFYAKQIPVLFFWTGTHNDYHKPSDTFEKINYDDEALILKMVARIVNQLDAADKRLTYTTAKSDAAPRTGGFRVYLGTIPNYADSNDGLLIDGVRDDSPAAKAGLKAGDKIVKIGTREIKNVYDYTAALGEMKAGEEYAVEVVRGTERLTLKLKPEARK